MNVQQCWRDLWNALQKRRQDDFDARMSELLQWLDDGGDPPSTYGIGSRETAVWMTRVLCERMRQRMLNNGDD